MKRSLNADLEEAATKWPTYAEHPQPLVYTLPFSGSDLIGFRRRWSEPGRLVSQTELGKLIGLGQRQIDRYESDMATITKMMVLALSYVDERLCAARAVGKQGTQ